MFPSCEVPIGSVSEQKVNPLDAAEDEDKLQERKEAEIAERTSAEFLAV